MPAGLKRASAMGILEPSEEPQMHFKIKSDTSVVLFIVAKTLKYDQQGDLRGVV